jgi:DNA-binding MarR family transcriptional regulator
MKQCRTTHNGSVTPGSCADLILEVVPAVMRVIRTEMRRQTAAEMTVVQFRSLALAEYRGGATVSEIAEHIGLTMPSASKLIDGLVGRGYLRRRPDPNDRRKTVLVATARGARAVAIARRTTAEHLSKLLDAMPAHELGAVDAAMKSLGEVFADHRRGRAARSA